MGTKVCNDCKEEKSVTEFYTVNRMRNGKQQNYLFYICKSCVKKKNKKRTSEIRHKWHIKATYNISTDDYNTMLNNQGGKCAICKQPETVKNKRLAVDHCHRTNKIRGLLCERCNTILGRVDDNVDLLKELIKYLEINN